MTAASSSDTSLEPLDRVLRAYATELHQLAYTVPNGHEHELLHLARRMQETADAAFHARVHHT